MAPLTSSPWYPVAVDRSIPTLSGFRADTASAGAHALDARRMDCTTMIRFAPTRIIDIAPLFSGGARATDRAVAEALSDHGSFVATGFAGAEGFGGRIADLLSFFSMEVAHKLACATCRHVPRNPNIYRGFYPLPEKPHWSHNEIFDIGPEPAMICPDVPGAESFRESNVWPSVEPVPDWRGRMLAMLDFQRELALVLMASIARGLGLEEEALLAPARGRNATLRLLRYAPAPPDFALRGDDGDEPEGIGDGRRLTAGSHVDTGLLSLLWQDETGGLQMRGPDGGWREVPPAPDGLSVHCGDLVKAPTGGRLEGTLHRAASHGGDRCSVGFFLEPDFESAVVAPAGGPPVSYARHLVNVFPDRFEAPRAA